MNQNTIREDRSGKKRIFFRGSNFLTLNLYKMNSFSQKEEHLLQKSSQNFTIIELLVVISIIAILVIFNPPPPLNAPHQRRPVLHDYFRRFHSLIKVTWSLNDRFHWVEPQPWKPSYPACGFNPEEAGWLVFD